MESKRKSKMLRKNLRCKFTSKWTLKINILK